MTCAPLARQYCAKGVTIKHVEYSWSHFTSMVQWLPQAMLWVNDRFWRPCSGPWLPQQLQQHPAWRALETVVYTGS